MSELLPIRLFITGGTFDKTYDELDGQMKFRDSMVKELLELGRSRLITTCETLMMMDSLQMKDHHRAAIASACEETEEQLIVITHGTDTMTETATFLSMQPALDTKTIILTGAMFPIRYGSSDGLFNLGSALAFVQTLPSGIYIAMNGKYFTYDNVMKNRITGIFEEVY